MLLIKINQGQRVIFMEISSRYPSWTVFIFNRVNNLRVFFSHFKHTHCRLPIFIRFDLFFNRFWGGFLSLIFRRKTYLNFIFIIWTFLLGLFLNFSIFSCFLKLAAFPWPSLLGFGIFWITFLVYLMFWHFLN